MATPRPEQPEKRLRKKKKPSKTFRLTYSLILLFAMLIVGSFAGVIAYNFGKQALDGVNKTPTGVKLPKPSPVSKPTDTPNPKPPNPDGKTSFLLDESGVIAEMKAMSQQELGGLTRPAFVPKSQISDRKKMYTRVDQAYKYMRDPLAVSANSDERIASRISDLRQRVDNNRYSSDADYNRFINTPSSDPLASKPLETDPIRAKWQNRDSDLGYRQVPVSTTEFLTQNNSISLDQQMPSTGKIQHR